MARVEELPDDYVGSSMAHVEQGDSQGTTPKPGPALPPDLELMKNQTVDEVAADLKKSPFFMTSLADAGDEDNPELDAIKSLLYEGTRAENAENFREQGNDYTKSKQWKDGRELYTKGLLALQVERRDEDPTGEEEDQKEMEIKEKLLVNRALCQLKLQNYRSCTLDCVSAISISPNNIKAHFRLASALFASNKLEDALRTCTAGLTIDPSNPGFLDLNGKVKLKKENQDAINRQRREREECAKQEASTLATALKIRRIRTKQLDVPNMGDDDAVMRLVPDPLSLESTLVFPVMILYPTVMQSDFIKQFGEEQTLQGHLKYMLPFPWDKKGEYTMNSIDAYIETIDGGMIKWGKNVELLKMLSGGSVEVVDGIVRVSVLLKSEAPRWIDDVKKMNAAAGLIKL